MSQEKEWILRAVSPELFEHITAELEKSNIHPNDIQANAIKKDDGLDVTVRFGDNFGQTRSQFFAYADINSNHESINTFANDIAEACREVMIADYFKMMKM